MAEPRREMELLAFFIFVLSFISFLLVLVLVFWGRARREETLDLLLYLSLSFPHGE